MFHRTSYHPLERMSDMGHGVGRSMRRHAGMSIGGVLTLAVIVGIGIWAWPEVHRTIRIHSM